MDNYDDDFYSPPRLKENEDYYMDPKGYRVITASYLARRGYCCGNGCRHCPYFPKHTKGNTVLKED